MCGIWPCFSEDGALWQEQAFSGTDDKYAQMLEKVCRIQLRVLEQKMDRVSLENPRTSVRLWIFHLPSRQLRFYLKDCL